jgi:polyvinyl alcohol dehydrogenase (cytochrome)
MTRASGIAAFTLLASTTAWAQSLDGAAVFKQNCATCHTGAADSRAPAPDTLRPRSPQSIVESLVTGAMRAQGARMSGAERRAVAEYLTGKTIAGDVRGADMGRCGVADQQLAARAPLPRWAGWSPAPTNTRMQTASDAGLTAATVPKLALKWSFGFPDASVAWSQPTVWGGRVYVGSQNGTVYALDANSGCIRWTYSARGGVRTALAVGPAAGSAPAAAYFGDTAANVYALDADTGRELWVKKIDEHRSRGSRRRRRCTTGASTWACRRTRSRRAPIRSTAAVRSVAA